MNLKDLSDEALNVAIHEALPKLPIPDDYECECDDLIMGELCPKCDKEEFFKSPIPNYTGSLDACAEVERGLNPNVRNDYVAHLWKVTGNEPSVNFWSEYNFRAFYACIHATARQRAEALYSTLILK